MGKAMVSVGRWESATVGLRKAAILGAVLLASCSSGESGAEGAANEARKGKTQVGEASYYGPRFHGQETASGETFNQNELTAAHPSLPMGTRAEVTNLSNGKSVDVRINDRGPYVDDRIIDLSKAAAETLGMKKDGTAQVKVEPKKIP